MSTLILLMLIFFVFKMLSEAAKKQTPRQDLPGVRISGDDAPLPGPWNRRTETGAESPLPGRWDIPAGSNGDAPLPGPWDRKPRREKPVESKKEPRWETEFEPEPAYEPGPVWKERRKPQPEVRSQDRAVEPVKIPEPRRGTDMDAPAPGRGAYPGPSDECKTVGLQERRAAAIQEPFRRKRKHRRANNPLTAVLSCQTTLVGSMVLGQVLGIRGGRAAERKIQR